MIVEKEKNIFIVGPPRSGTSLIAKELADKVGGFVVTEVPLITYFAHHFRYKKGKKCKGLTSVFDRYYSIATPSLKEKDDFNGLYKAYITSWAQKKLEVVIDKNPFYAFQIKHILRFFPDAKILFVCRDSLATVNSHVQNNHKLGKEIGFHSHLWNFFINEYRVIKQEYADHVMLVRYEDFVSQENKELDKIVDFCETIPVVKHTSENQQVVIGNDDRQGFVDDLIIKINKPIDKSKLNQWKEDLTEEDQEQISLITSENRKFLKYSKDAIVSSNNKKGYLKARTKILLEKSIYYLPLSIKNLRLRSK